MCSNNLNLSKNEQLRLESYDYWDSLYKNSDYDYKKLADNSEWSYFIKELNNKNIKTILDLGCGAGTWSIVMARAGFNVKSIDISQKALDYLDNWAEKEKLSSLIGTSQEEIQKYTPTNEYGKYDLIVCNSVLDHLIPLDINKTLNNIYELLKISGYVYLSFDENMKDEPDSYNLMGNGLKKYISGD